MNKLFKQHITREIPRSYNGGGKGGGTTVVEAAKAPKYNDKISGSSVSNLLTKQGESFDERDAVEKEKGIKRKSLGTRGLQIPLTKGQTAPTPKSAASTGIQI